jgi:DNA-binding HxlR family transcriptional regulator
MARGYGQYCPLSLAAELLCQRWTLLVISRIIDGCTRFNEIQRGVHRMSPSLLSKRLTELEDYGLILSRKLPGSRAKEYLLTEAGRELEPILMQMAVWGQHWAREMEDDDLDPAFLVWSMHTRFDVAAMPAGRTVLEFRFTGAPKDCRQFWLVNRDGGVEMCIKDPGLEVDVLVSSDLRIFVETWRGFRDLQAELRARRIRVEGPPKLVEEFPSWLLLSALSPFPRRRPGREQRLARSVPARLEAAS